MPDTPVSGGSGSQPVGFESQPATALGEVRELIRGNAGAILLVVLACLATAAVYLWFAPPRYVARATLLVDPASSSMPEEYYIESQTQLMRSDPIVRAVIGQFDPADIVQDSSANFFRRQHHPRRMPIPCRMLYRPFGGTWPSHARR